MYYEPIPDHLNCTFRGCNSPVLLRFEVATDNGGMTFEEYKDTPPFISLYGEAADAKAQFRIAIESVAEYLLSLERDSTIRRDGCLARPVWFQMDLRVPGEYRAMLYGEGAAYRFSYMGIDDRINTLAYTIDAIRPAYDRLKAVYKTFFNMAV